MVASRKLATNSDGCFKDRCMSTFTMSFQQFENVDAVIQMAKGGLDSDGLRIYIWSVAGVWRPHSAKDYLLLPSFAYQTECLP